MSHRPSEFPKRKAATYLVGFAAVLAAVVAAGDAISPDDPPPVFEQVTVHQELTLGSLDERVTANEGRLDVIEEILDISTTTTTTTTTAPPAVHWLFTEDTTLDEPITLRPGDTLELRNEARLSFGPGSHLDAQGTPTETWAIDWGIDPDGNPAPTVTQNIDRDVKIFGQGDLRFEAGSGASLIKWVEIDLQPKIETGRYPLHWHHVGDGSRGTVVEGVVVKHSTNRAYVTHASHGITIAESIAYDITGTPFWWDLPDGHSDETNNSNDITWHRVLAHDVKVPEGSNGFKLAGFFLGAGTGNKLTDSAAVNVAGTSQSAGAHWPSQAAGNPGGTVWEFDGFQAFDVFNCWSSWQNGASVPFGPHPTTNMRCGVDAPIYVGAYSMQNLFDNVTADVMKIWSVNTEVRNSTIGLLQFEKPGVASGANPILIEDSQIGAIRIVQPNTPPARYQTIVINNSGVTCADVTVQSAAAQTTLTIDGEVCDL